MDSYQPGDIIVSQFTIGGDQALDISNSYYSFKVYEGISMPNCILELLMYDTDDYLATGRITGGEQINLSFCAPGTPVLSYVFTIDKPENVEITGAQKGKTYSITGVGTETMTSKSKFMNKSYNTNVSDIVSDIVSSQLNSSKPLSVEATQGQQSIVISQQNPLDAIDMVRRRAVSPTNKSSTYTYFENAKGLNFKTIEGMMQGGSVKTFSTGDAAPGHDPGISTANNIISYQVQQLATASTRLDMGSLMQRTSTFDKRTRQYVFDDLKIPGAGGSVPNPGGFNSQNFVNQFGQQYSFFSMIPWDSFSSPTGINSTTPYQMAYIGNLLQLTLNMKVNGDTTYCAGDIVTLNIKRSYATTEDPPPYDPLYGQEFKGMIAHICRNVGPQGDHPRYTDDIEIMSGSLAS